MSPGIVRLTRAGPATLPLLCGGKNDLIATSWQKYLRLRDQFFHNTEAFSGLRATAVLCTITAVHYHSQVPEERYSWTFTGADKDVLYSTVLAERLAFKCDLRRQIQGYVEVELQISAPWRINPASFS